MSLQTSDLQTSDHQRSIIGLRNVIDVDAGVLPAHRDVLRFCNVHLRTEGGSNLASSSRDLNTADKFKLASLHTQHGLLAVCS